MESCQTADEICELTVDAAESILQFDICGVDLIEDDHFVPTAISTGMTNDGYSKLRTNEGIAGKTHQNNETYVIDDVREESDAVPAQAEYRSLLSVPVGDEGIFQAGRATSRPSTATTPNWPNCWFHTPPRRFDESTRKRPFG
ncbi:GAF domain-containing protein, partial [Haladaptatus sp. W1]|uniref:GAF domain-containing protein n=1 Tax=Haladaptatus sp. W1 TaxID=1897478 RepID=UPI0020C7DBCB